MRRQPPPEKLGAAASRIYIYNFIRRMGSL